MERWKGTARALGDVLRETGVEYVRDKASMMAAAVAFYAVLSIAPLLVVAVVGVGIAFDEARARAQIVAGLYTILSGPAARTAVQMLDEASAPGLGTMSGVVSFAVTGWTATRLFISLQDALNHIWNIGPLPRQGVRKVAISLARKRALTFLLLLGLGLLMLLSLVAEAVISIVEQPLTTVAGSWLVFRAVDFIMSIALASTGVGLVYWILPDVRIGWRSVWHGALITGAALVLGRLGIGLYFSRIATTTLQGAVGSVFALLLWVYLSAMVFFFGAELTEVIARRRGDADALLARRVPTSGSPRGP